MDEPERSWQDEINGEEALGMDLRCEALHAATALHVAHAENGLPELPDDVLETAEKYLRFLKGDLS